MSYKFKALKKMFADGGQVKAKRTNDEIMENDLADKLYNNEIPKQTNPENYNDEYDNTYDTRKLIDEGKIKKQDVPDIYKKLKKSKPI